MKLSTEIGSAVKIVGYEKAIALCGQAGFDAWDLSMFSVFSFDWQTRRATLTDHPFGGPDYLRYARELRRIGEDHGMVCNQSHAPFPVDCPQIRDFLKRAIECTAEAGGRICVIHPDNNKSAEENAQMYWKLLPFAHDCGVKIATENMWNWDDVKDVSSFAACATGEDFCRHIDVVNDPYFVACLDIGHAQMKGSGTGAVNMIHDLGPRLQALHVHDNDLWHDCHQIPFSMNVDFPAVIRALKDVGYAGDMTLEADGYLHAYTADNILEGMKNLAASGRKLIRLYESL